MKLWVCSSCEYACTTLISEHTACGEMVSSFHHHFTFLDNCQKLSKLFSICRKLSGPCSHNNNKKQNNNACFRSYPTPCRRCQQEKSRNTIVNIFSFLCDCTEIFSFIIRYGTITEFFLHYTIWNNQIFLSLYNMEQSHNSSSII